jgi:uncharacterized protein (TIGR03792 family)
VVIEFLTFRVDPAELAEWLSSEEATWSRFLERQDGFVSKQMWVERDRPGEVHAVITWRNEESWKAIPQTELDAVDAAFGRWVREPTCRTFDVIRDC